MSRAQDARGGQDRALLADIFRAGVAAAQGGRLLAEFSRFDGREWRYRHGTAQAALDLPAQGRVIVVGAGKAVAALGEGLEAVLGGRIDAGRLVVKSGHGAALARIAVSQAAHPVPDAAGVAATQAVLDCVAGLSAEDRVFVLLTGGASALLAAPAPGVTLADKQAMTELLLRSGAAIGEINAVRRRLSTVKGGGLLRAIGPAPSLTLMICDIPDGDPVKVGSGPTYPDPSPPGEALAILRRYGLERRTPPGVLRRLARPPEPPPSTERAAHLVLADSATALAAAAERARALGYAAEVVDPRLDGDAHAAARRFAAALRRPRSRATILLAAGETTLKVTGRGKGGRCQELALVAARELAGQAGAALLAAGTDGTDGPTDAAGAFADATTVARAAAAGIDLDAVLAANDANPALAALGDLFVTGPTGTNVMDLIVGISGGQPVPSTLRQAAVSRARSSSGMTKAGVR
jgi:glycerate-2-kinase